MDWSLSPIFGSFTLVLLFSLAFLLLLILLNETGRITRWQSICLWSLRLLTCLVLLLVLLKPGITFTRQSTPPGTIAVVLDESASMQLAFGDGERSRWQVQLETIDRIWKQRDTIGSNSIWQSFLYGKNLRPLSAGGSSSPTVAAPEKANEPVTDIGGPLSQLMSMNLESPLSAVIWMGDGAQTLNPASIDPMLMSRKLLQIDVPLYMVGIGPRAQSENSRDLSVTGIPEQIDVFTKNQFNLVGSLRARGVANRSVAVRLYLKTETNESTELTRVILNPTRDDETIPFQLGLIAPEPGAYELLVRADPVAGEITEQNNQQTTYLNVRDGGSRILFLEGEARFEMKFMRNSIAESKDFTLSTRPIRKPPVQNWPIDLTEQLSGSAYDCIILGDVDYRAIDAAGAQLIAEQVRNGTGLITLGGYHTYAPGGWGESQPFRDLLPVVLGTAPRQPLDGTVDTRSQIAGPVKLNVVGNPEMLRIDETGGLAIWNELNPLLGANRWEGIKNTPGTVLLAKSDRNEPLMVAGQAGMGRVLCLAFDSTYVWVRQGRQEEHKAFWRQLIYWCMRREVVEEGMNLRMSRRRLTLSESAEVILDWNGGTDNLEMPSNISLHLWKISDTDSASQPVDLGEVIMSKRDNKSLRANFPGTANPGRYEWRASTVGSQGQRVEAKLPFIVEDLSLENLQPIPDWGLMEQMVRLNRDAGGKLFTPDQADEIVSLLRERRKMATETIVENQRLGDGIVDSWITFLLLGALMISQWGLRKRWNLP
ncbi:hypothetical protein SH449x_004947 [Pirellulaceae bacterium SH449]